MSSGPSLDSTIPQFRHGLPIRLQGWLSVKVKHRFGLNRYEPRLVKVNGEVLSLQSAADSPKELFDLCHANIFYSIKSTSRSFIIEFARKSYSFQCSSHEEMIHWANNCLLASQRNFHNHYKVASKLAEGTDSTVYLCSDIDDETDVYAVKMIKWLHKKSDCEERIQKERHINSVLSHKHILQAVDIFSTTEIDYIVFEYMHGGTLRDMLDKRLKSGHKALPESYARAIMRQLFVALHYLDENNIVHRDIRPDNIFLSEKRFPLVVTIGDFGYADFVSQKRVNREVLTGLIGTPPYIAAEICQDQKYGPLVDMWSAGVTLFEMLSGQLPFHANNDHQLIQQIKHAKINFNLLNNVSTQAKSFVQQLLQPDPHKRISALAALHHQWMTNEINPRQSIPLHQQLPTSPTTAGTQLDDRNSTGTTSLDGNKKQTIMQTSLSNMSSSSSQSPIDIKESEQSEPSERQTSSLGPQPSLRSMQPLSSTSSLSGMQQPRLAVTHSVREIQRDGLSRVYSKKPALMKQVLSSPLVQRQLSIFLTKRRQLIVTARAFIAVFRLKALVGGHSATRQLSNMNKADDIEKFIETRKAAFNRFASNDRDTTNGLPVPQKRGHVRQLSKGASNVIGKLKLDSKYNDNSSNRSRISLDRKKAQETSVKP